MKFSRVYFVSSIRSLPRIPAPLCGNENPPHKFHAVEVFLTCQAIGKQLEIFNFYAKLCAFCFAIGWVSRVIFFYFGSSNHGIFESLSRVISKSIIFLSTNFLKEQFSLSRLPSISIAFDLWRAGNVPRVKNGNFHKDAIRPWF